MLHGGWARMLAINRDEPSSNRHPGEIRHPDSCGGIFGGEVWGDSSPLGEELVKGWEAIARMVCLSAVLREPQDGIA